MVDLGIGLVLRAPTESDWSLGLGDTLSQLSTLDDLDERRFREILAHWRDSDHIYVPRVIEDTSTHTILASGMLLIEQKLIHGGSKVS